MHNQFTNSTFGDHLAALRLSAEEAIETAYATDDGFDLADMHSHLRISYGMEQLAKAAAINPTIYQRLSLPRSHGYHRSEAYPKTGGCDLDMAEYLLTPDGIQEEKDLREWELEAARAVDPKFCDITGNLLGQCLCGCCDPDMRDAWEESQISQYEN